MDSRPIHPIDHCERHLRSRLTDGHLGPQLGVGRLHQYELPRPGHRCCQLDHEHLLARRNRSEHHLSTVALLEKHTLA